MARPRIFISSTFYDLRQVRSDIERFHSGAGATSRFDTRRAPFHIRRTNL